jgi:hypothetical protein
MEPGIIREIYIYGNGIVEYFCRTHHVFVVLGTTENEIIEKEKFILLEVKKSRRRIIKIRIETDSSLENVINRRFNMIDYYISRNPINLILPIELKKSILLNFAYLFFPIKILKSIFCILI